MLPVDTSTRPLQDVNIDKSEEFTRKVEIVKKEKRKRDSDRSDGEGENKHKKKHKKDRKRDKRSKKRSHRDATDDEDNLEAGELVEPHPLVTLTNIDPDEIPDQPANKFLMRGDPKRDNDRTRKRDSGNDRDRGYQKRQRDWGGDYYRRTRTTKSGRIVKGRGKFCFRTPSRSRSRSITPIHWRKEEARVIKMSEFEKLEAERKRLEATKSVNGKEKTSTDRRSSSREKQDPQSYTPKKKKNSKIDYNALDYEEPGDQEHEIKKQVPSLVQYPLPGAHNTFKSAAEVEEELKKEEEKQEEVAAINKRSDFLAMALGVQIKTGEDPPNSEMIIGGLSKQNRNKFHQQNLGSNIRGNQDRFSGGRFSDEGRFYRPPFHAARQRTPPIPQIASKVEEKKSRNKFETEKKVPTVESQIIPRNGKFEDMRHAARDRRFRNDLQGRFGRDRGRDRRRGNTNNRLKSRERRRSRSSSKGSKTRRRSQSVDKTRDSRKGRSPKRSSSPRHSRSHDRSKKRDGSRRRSRSHSSKSKSVERRIKIEPGSDKSKDDLLRMDKDAEEKYKKLLILRKKMELLELKKKKEEEQKLLEEKQRKAKEESEMLEKAKLAKREAIEKEKLMKSYKVLQEIDDRKVKPRRSSSSSSSSSTSSSSSSSSSSSHSSNGHRSKKKGLDTPLRSRKRDKRSRSRSRRRSTEKRGRSRSRSKDHKHTKSYRK